MYYLQSRYYDPELSRFISADDYIIADNNLLSSNMFAYCLNNPINAVDENGNKVWTYTFTVQETGENTYDILLFANNGKVSQPMVTETITVNEDNGAVNPFNAILELIKRILQFFREIFASRTVMRSSAMMALQRFSGQ